ncbi:hypothetical protein K1719_042377 [Acacia pycnantha]|nr:hypothetical protein K1719_042377 [Acacia pycnantha]
MAAASSSSSSSWTYDVFLSFRGFDTRLGLTSHLHAALKQSGIDVYMDGRLQTGEEISYSLLQAIERSRMALVILSPDYASSRWCLDELVKIMECRVTRSLVAIPIFYKVDPFHVRHQRGKYGDAMEQHQQRLGRESDLVLQWRQALTETANLSGFDSSLYRIDRDEAKMIEEIVEQVVKILEVGYGRLFVAEYPVGIETRVHELTIEWSKMRSQKSLIIGLWGMGGSGKTTLAKAIYNKIGRQFGARSFLANIRENSKHANDQVNLQRQLISDITKTQVFKIPDIDRGKKIIEERFPNIEAFIVLDDVDSVNQLKALCGSLERFGPRSVIIITTRDLHLLEVLEAQYKYRIREMDEVESLELFSWHAFKQATPFEIFKELSKNVVDYCGRLPLALEILGSCLCDRTILEWSAALSKLQRIPNKDIHAKLKISYDGLNDYTEKEIFLDICCFFINKDRNYVTQILDGCRLHANSGLQILIERSLVKIGTNNKLEMHDLLQEMGKEITRESSHKDPEKRSKLWFHEDVLEVLTEHTGTKAIEGISLKMETNPHRECLVDSKAFKKMRKLRLLQLDYVNVEGDYKHLSRGLRWLCWHGFPLEYVPNNFHQKKLVAIDFKCSNLKGVWKEPQLLEMLKTLNLSHSSYLEKTPDFTYLPNLERLVMKDCRSLILIHDSIGDLKNLLYLNIKDCKSLRELPRSIYKLKSLKTLILSGCSLIDHLEEDFEQMEGLTTLMADNTAITQVPFSLARLGWLVQHGYVSLCGYEGRAQDIFPSLVSSWMSRSNIPQSRIEEFVQSISSLVLSVGQNSDFHGISPFQFATPAGSFNSLLLQLGVCDKVDFLKDRITQGWNYGGWDDSHLPGDQYPDWFIYRGEGFLVNFKVPLVIGCQLKAMLLNVVYYSCMDNTTTPQFLINVVIINHTKATIMQQEGDWSTFHEDAKWQSIIPSVQPGDLVQLFLSIGPQIPVKKIAAYLIYDDSKHRTLLN